MGSTPNSKNLQLGLGEITIVTSFDTSGCKNSTTLKQSSIKGHHAAPHHNQGKVKNLTIMYHHVAGGL
jgi:hypothetical protein